MHRLTWCRRTLDIAAMHTDIYYPKSPYIYIMLLTMSVTYGIETFGYILIHFTYWFWLVIGQLPFWLSDSVHLLVADAYSAYLFEVHAVHLQYQEISFDHFLKGNMFHITEEIKWYGLKYTWCWNGKKIIKSKSIIR